MSAVCRNSQGRVPLRLSILPKQKVAWFLPHLEIFFFKQEGYFFHHICFPMSTNLWASAKNQKLRDWAERAFRFETVFVFFFACGKSEFALGFGESRSCLSLWFFHKWCQLNVWDLIYGFLLPSCQCQIHATSFPTAEISLDVIYGWPLSFSRVNSLSKKSATRHSAAPLFREM